MPHKIRHCERHTIEWTFMLCLVKVSVFFFNSERLYISKRRIEESTKNTRPTTIEIVPKVLNATQKF
jgi:hypothetical protein